MTECHYPDISYVTEVKEEITTHMYTLKLVKALMCVETRSSATAEKQRVRCACLPIGWLTDCAMHRTPQSRRGCIIFDIQTL